MRYYENLFIVNPSYEGESLDGLKNQFVHFIEENGGRIYNVEDWGKKRLAYKIDKQKYGTYVLVQFSAEGPVIRELEESQRLNDSVLGYLTVRLDEEPDLSKRREQMEAEEAEESDEEETIEEVEEEEEPEDSSEEDEEAAAETEDDDETDEEEETSDDDEEEEKTDES